MLAADLVDIVHEFDDHTWDASGPTRAVEATLESGQVLAFPRLSFELTSAEQRFLDPCWSDGKSKNISVRWPSGDLRGATGAEQDLAALRRLIVRYAEASETLVHRLFPHYRPHLQRGNSSLRPFEVTQRAASWRQDDSRLHVDAFPSNPMQGTRLLRVFNNLNPAGVARTWRVGEPFDAMAKRYLPKLTRPLPGSARLLAALGITKHKRTPYDHAMLQLHDLAKADNDFQRESPQAEVAFQPGTTWVVFSDQVLHAVMGGQHMLEQTFYLAPQHQQQPERSPFHTLERLLQRPMR